LRGVTYKGKARREELTEQAAQKKREQENARREAALERARLRREEALRVGKTVLRGQPLQGPSLTAKFEAHASDCARAKKGCNCTYSMREKGESASETCNRLGLEAPAVLTPALRDRLKKNKRKGGVYAPNPTEVTSGPSAPREPKLETVVESGLYAQWRRYDPRGIGTFAEFKEMRLATADPAGIREQATRGKGKGKAKK